MAHTQILQASDLHVGKSDAITARCATMVDRIIGRWPSGSARPIVMLTGDVVEDGHEEQYKIAGQHVQRLRTAGFRVLCVPGNHDYGWKGNHAKARKFKLFKKYLGTGLRITYPEHVVLDGVLLIGLNSMLAETGFWDGLLANGELGSKQRGRLDEMLEIAEPRRASGEWKVVVYLHHHPFIFPGAGLTKRLYEKVGHDLKDGEHCMATLRKRVDVLMFGHDHAHVDFGKQVPEARLVEEYGIDHILSCGATTETDELRSWLVDMPEDGEIAVSEVRLGA